MITDTFEQQKIRVATPTRQLPDHKVSTKFEGLSVLGLVGDYSACGYYRIINPLTMLKMHGAKVKIASVQTYDMFHEYQNIVAPRQHEDEIREILLETGWNHNLIFEVDDNLDAVMPSSPAYNFYYPGSPYLKSMARIIQSCHGLTTTTPELAKWYSRYTQNTCVIGNFIDFSFRDWGSDVHWFGESPLITSKPISRPAEWGDKFVVGYSAGSTHAEDFAILGPHIKKLLDSRDDVIFAMYMGIDMCEAFVKQFNLPDGKWVHIPARHFLDHPSGLHGFDIGVAPLVSCEFNLAKSDLKVLEYLAVGAIPVTSHVGPYAKFNARHPDQILTVGTGKESYRSWYEAITILLDNPNKLRAMQKQGRELIQDNYALEKNFALWPWAWMSIRNEVVKGRSGPPSKVLTDQHYKSYGIAGRNDPCPCGSGTKKKNCCGDQAFG